jgi:hypothetical protein
MANHILIARAHQFPIPNEPPICGWSYRRDIGAWVLQDQPDQLMVSGAPDPRPQPSPKPKPRPPMSKKEDIETGEDMKGE